MEVHLSGPVSFNSTARRSAGAIAVESKLLNGATITVLRLINGPTFAAHHSVEAATPSARAEITTWAR
jgi:hypothetical protein